MKTWLARGACWLWWWCAAHTLTWAGEAPSALNACTVQVLAVAAAPETPAHSGRPADGWEAVSVPDVWNSRWPEHDGAVWYRIDWTPRCADIDGQTRTSALGLGIDGISMAGEVYVNDTLIWRDASLVEPLSLSWNSPRWWWLPETTWHSGTNTVWVRVVAAVGATSGIGAVRLGTAEQVRTIYAERLWRQRTVYFITIGLSGALGGVFLVVWCMRRRERAFGWYAVTALCWVVYLAGVLSTSPWPFADTQTFARVHNVPFILYVLSFCLFTWRFGGQRWPTLERWLWTAAALGIGVSLLGPKSWQALSWIAFMFIFLLNCAQFPFHAWRTRDPQHILLAICWTLFLAVGIHDLVVMLDGWRAHDMWGAVSSLVIVAFMALLLGGRLVTGMQRTERFNHELAERVASARTELAEALQREHHQALTHATLQERMHIVHDLHDGLGGSLVRSMALVEQASQPLSNERMLSLLKSMRDDLRQVIDHGSSAGASVPQTPVQWMAPLRHRFTRLFDDLDIQAQWTVDSHWQHAPNALLCLGLTRLVEEALSNVIKHSRARQVSVSCQQQPNGELDLQVQDDGVGFDVAAVQAAGLSVGMRSMAARVQRLGGTFQVTSGQQGTRLRVTVRPASSP